MQRTWLDRTIEWVSPEAGVRRFRARSGLEAAATIARSFDAAKVGRRTEGWLATGTDANTELVTGLSRIQARCRDLVRNNPHAKAAVNALVRHTVRTGIVAKWSNERVQAEWDNFQEYCDASGDQDGYGLQGLMANSWFESGEVLMRFITPAKEYRGRIPLALQVLEADYLDARKTGMVGENGNPVVAGKEYDQATGRCIAYWLYPDHPGNLIGVHRGLVSTRVPAKDVVHLYRKTRPGQLRGVSELAVSVMRFRDFADYRDALLMKRKIEACFVGFIGAGEGVENGTPVADASGQGKRIERFAPGMIIYGREGEQMQFGQPSGTGDDGSFSKGELRAISAGAGVTYEQLTGDLSDVNYSSIRAGLVEFRTMIEMLQWLVFIPVFLRPVANRFAADGFNLGSLTIGPGNIKVDWTTPKMDQVDPLKEELAAKEAIKGGTKSLSETWRERGKDPDKQMKEMQTEREALKKAGITLDTILEALPAADPAKAKAIADAATADETTPAKQALELALTYTP